MIYLMTLIVFYLATSYVSWDFKWFLNPDGVDRVTTVMVLTASLFLTWLTQL